MQDFVFAYSVDDISCIGRVVFSPQKYVALEMSLFGWLPLVSLTPDFAWISRMGYCDACSCWWFVTSVIKYVHEIHALPLSSPAEVNVWLSIELTSAVKYADLKGQLHLNEKQYQCSSRVAAYRHFPLPSIFTSLFTFT